MERDFYTKETLLLKKCNHSIMMRRTFKFGSFWDSQASILEYKNQNETEKWIPTKRRSICHSSVAILIQ